MIAIILPIAILLIIVGIIIMTSNRKSFHSINYGMTEEFTPSESELSYRVIQGGKRSLKKSKTIKTKKSTLKKKK